MNPIRRWLAAAAVLLCVITVLPLASGQQGEVPKRKVVNRVMPVYPSMARTLNLHGNVKVDAVVAADGTVRAVEVRGGHPILVEAAESAVRKWKFEPAQHESREPVEVIFEP